VDALEVHQIHDPQSRVYELANEYDGRRAVPKNFFTLLESYQNHPEAKSLGPDGKACKYRTRADCYITGAHRRQLATDIFGKESDSIGKKAKILSLLDSRLLIQAKGKRSCDR